MRLQNITKPSAKVLTIIAILLTTASLEGIACTSRETFEAEKIAYIESLQAWSQPQPSGIKYWIEARLIPADGAHAESSYSVELWKKGHLVQTKPVRWSQDELNMRKTKTIKFFLPKGELPPFGVDISDIFEVKVSLR